MPLDAKGPFPMDTEPNPPVRGLIVAVTKVLRSSLLGKPYSMSGLEQLLPILALQTAYPLESHPPKASVR